MIPMRRLNNDRPKARPNPIFLVLPHFPTSSAREMAIMNKKACSICLVRCFSFNDKSIGKVNNLCKKIHEIFNNSFLNCLNSSDFMSTFLRIVLKSDSFKFGLSKLLIKKESVISSPDKVCPFLTISFLINE